MATIRKCKFELEELGIGSYTAMARAVGVIEVNKQRFTLNSVGRPEKVSADIKVWLQDALEASRRA